MTPLASPRDSPLQLVVLDTSAIIAILSGEPERARFVAVVANATDPLISASTLVESSIVMLALTGLPE
jgi:uncharacterized protein with PIN domain